MSLTRRERPSLCRPPSCPSSWPLLCVRCPESKTLFLQSQLTRLLVGQPLLVRLPRRVAVLLQDGGAVPRAFPDDVRGLTSQTELALFWPKCLRSCLSYA